MTFLLGTRFVFNPLGDYEHLAFLQRHRAIAKFDAQLSFKDNEYFVGVGVSVPDETALGLYQLEMIIVHLRHNLW